ncbi:MAG: glycosyltransferase [Verrucomicrobia bacterium]|nr:glycosyltransferase [Kiritimatiellia bacterium]MCO6399683.1 glycosyltransferase [Verrucomicrobiota bacterium]
MNTTPHTISSGTLAVVFSRFGPYHLARLKGARREIESAGGSLAAIAVASSDGVYAWDRVEGEANNPVHVIFGDRAYEEIPAADLADRLRALLDELDPIAVALPGWAFLEARVGLRWCQKKKRAAILMSESAKGDHFRLWPRELAKQFLVRQFHAALVGGRRHAEYARLLGIPRACIFWGYDAVDNDYFIRESDRVRSCAAAERAAGGLPKRYYLTSSRFVLKKNLAGLLRGYALHTARVPDSPDLVVCGDGPLRSSLIELARELKLESRVHFVGFIQYADLPRYYALAEAFILASTTEQWGLVVNEAAAAALPLLVSNRCGSAPELVNEGENGFTFCPMTPQAIAEAFEKLPVDSAVLQRYGQRSRELVAEHSPRIFGEKLLEAARMGLARLGREDLGPPGGLM